MTTLEEIRKINEARAKKAMSRATKERWTFDPVSMLDMHERMEAMIDRMSAKNALMALLVGPLRELCYEIEKLPASEQQTRTIILASDIAREVKSIADGELAENAVNPISEYMQAYRKSRIELEKEDV